SVLGVWFTDVAKVRYVRQLGPPMTFRFAPTARWEKDMDVLLERAREGPEAPLLDRGCGGEAVKLPPTDKRILSQLQKKSPLPGKALVKRTGAGADYIRRRLALLVEQGVLRHGSEGYSLPEGGPPPV